jgi:hypothetical protein
LLNLLMANKHNKEILRRFKSTLDFPNERPLPWLVWY